MSAALSPEANVIRAFFAIELASTARSAAASVADALRAKQPGNDVRWVRPENYHVTLRFVGNIDASETAALARNVALELRPGAPFEVVLESSQPFPRANEPRAVVLGLSPYEPLATLAAAVERGAVASGLRPDRRAFRSHLTLGRVRRGARTRRGVFAGEDPRPASFVVREVVLLRSELRTGGPEYTALERIPLGASDHPISTED